MWALLLGAWARDGSTLVTTSNDRRDGLDGWSAGEWSCLRTLAPSAGVHMGYRSDASVRVGFRQLYPRHHVVIRRDGRCMSNVGNYRCPLALTFHAGDA